MNDTPLLDWDTLYELSGSTGSRDAMIDYACTEVNRLRAENADLRAQIREITTGEITP